MITVYISRLRKKLGDDLAGAPRYIFTGQALATAFPPI